VALAEARLRSDLQQAAATRDAVRSSVSPHSSPRCRRQQKLAIHEAVTAVERERDELQGGLERAALEKEIAEKSLKDKYETQMRDRDDAIERLKDMKARLSTKMVGETLEQHCEVSSTASAPPRSRAPISRRTTTPAPAARVTTSFAIPTRPAPRSCPSCSR
jgi:hypothetical protein